MKDKFIKNTIILTIAGIIVKGLGLINRIIITRLLGTEGIAIYMMTFPTLILFITLAQIGLPLAISKLISENNVTRKHDTKDIISNAMFISMVISSILVVSILIILKPLTHNWLANPNTFYPILTVIPLIPLVSISGILKGYLIGNKKMSITSNAHILEQIVRILFSITLVYFLAPYGIVAQVTGSLISLSIGEFISCLYLVYKINKGYHKPFFKPQITGTSKSILDIALPSTSSRIVGSVAYFLEPIIFTLALKNLISNSEIQEYYGILTGFTLSLIFIPSFFTQAISTSLIPNIAEAYSKNNYVSLKKLFNTTIKIITIPIVLFIIVARLYAGEAMQMLFGTTAGADIVTKIIPWFFIFYFQAPLISILHSINESKKILKHSLIFNILKIVLIIYLCQIPSINVNGLLISLIIAATLSTVFYFLNVYKKIKIKISLFKILIFVLIALSTNYLLINLPFENFIVNIAIITVYYGIAVKLYLNFIKNV